MPRLAPVSWIKFIKKMKTLGFDGPFQEGKHPYTIKGNVSVTIPNHHFGDISPDLLSCILKQAGISRILWTEK
jgi:predicted RNA binding protein YcfA (HicA-like mRNA interferase family)